MTMTYPYTLKEAITIQRQKQKEYEEYQQEQTRQYNEINDSLLADTRDISFEQKVWDYLSRKYGRAERVKPTLGTLPQLHDLNRLSDSSLIRSQKCGIESTSKEIQS